MFLLKQPPDKKTKLLDGTSEAVVKAEEQSGVGEKPHADGIPEAAAESVVQIKPDLNGNLEAATKPDKEETKDLNGIPENAVKSEKIDEAKTDAESTGTADIKVDPTRDQSEAIEGEEDEVMVTLSIDLLNLRVLAW